MAKFICIRDNGSLKLAEFQNHDDLYIGTRVFRLNEDQVRLRIHNILENGGDVTEENKALAEMAK